MALKGPRAVRNLTVCARCRSKRIKCDKLFPRCRNCEKKNVECVSIDPGTGETISRSYVHDLKQEVIFLKKEIESLKSDSAPKTIYDNSAIKNDHVDYHEIISLPRHRDQVENPPPDELPKRNWKD